MTQKKKPKNSFSRGVALGGLLTLLVGFGVLMMMQALEAEKSAVEENQAATAKEGQSEDNQDKTEVVKKEQLKGEVQEAVDQGGSDKAETEAEIKHQATEAEAQGKPVYQNKNYGYSLSYPDDWKAKESSTAQTALYPNSKAVNNDYQGDILVNYKQNPQGLGVEEFYDGQNQVNLFFDATGGNKEVVVAGKKAYEFKGVEGYVPSNVVVVPVEGGFLEMTDMGAQHETDGVFDEVINSLELN
ncbi:hypothetical protein KKC60_01185 [Patescibacteria group bacterium]|nr:hypothetical protein [Patescibacteria group bacterium]